MVGGWRQTIIPKMPDNAGEMLSMFSSFAQNTRRRYYNVLYLIIYNMIMTFIIIFFNIIMLLFYYNVLIYIYTSWIPNFVQICDAMICDAMFQHPAAGELQRLHQRRWRRWSVAAGAGAPADAGAAGAWRMVWYRCQKGDDDHQFHDM